MPKKKKLLLSIATLCLIISIVTIVVLSNQLPSTTEGTLDENDAEPKSTDAPDGPLFVIPENTLGTIGLISALMTAFGIFAIKNKKIKLPY